VIPIFIASSERFEEVEWLTDISIRQNTDSEVEIHIVRPQWFGMQEHGCTGFTNVRFAIPQLCRELGYEFGIYLDVDMLVLGDIAELWEYRKKGKRAVLEEGSDEVSVCCSSLRYPDKKVLHARHKGTLPRGDDAPTIPLVWNVEDQVKPNAKIVHYTSLDHQPWFNNHFNKEAAALYASYCDRYRTELDGRSNRADKRVRFT